MHTHTCMHTHMNTLMHAHTHTHTHIHKNTHACTHMNRDAHRHDREGNSSTEVMSHCTLDPYNNVVPFSYRTLPIPNTHAYTIYSHTPQ